MADIAPQGTTPATAAQPTNDDQELAKALASVMPETAAPTPVAPPPPPPAPILPALQFEETPAPGAAPAAPAAVPSAPGVPASGLDGIKKDALNELRPLIDKVELPPDEKFDTYLLLIRSTDDATLIGPAHAAAQAIPDEKRKAEALLDIIKEIDYLSQKDKPAL